MVKAIEHIGIVVKNMDNSIEKYTKLLGLVVDKIEEVDVQGAITRVAFMPLGSIDIELLFTTAETGLLADFFKTRGEGIHHIAFEVENIEKMFEELQLQGVKFMWNKIIDGSRGTRCAFFEAEEMNGVYIELVQKKFNSTDGKIALNEATMKNN